VGVKRIVVGVLAEVGVDVERASLRRYAVLITCRQSLRCVHFAPSRAELLLQITRSTSRVEPIHLRFLLDDRDLATFSLLCCCEARYIIFVICPIDESSTRRSRIDAILVREVGFVDHGWRKEGRSGAG
jgi:hypothetical protein